ncbi:NAD(+)/NADH kinase [Candidatus Micrarchaeota archaeon]|nr:NAD(+)/NADH kinase [Candidatus Micrarchaeota archaeon]
MKIKLIPNPKKSWAVALSKELADFLTEHNYSVVNKGADTTICIGGDGTILYSNHEHFLEGPVLGIGSETSYICQITLHTWKKELLNILKNKKTVKIMTIKTIINGRTITAINDFVLHSSDYRVVKINVNFSNTTHTFSGDGIILSSAIGTAGYAYSAGGKMLKPEERKISVVPICPYRRTFLPTVLDENAAIGITINRDCAFIVDGIFVQNLKGETISIKKGEDITFFEGVGYYKQG